MEPAFYKNKHHIEFRDVDFTKKLRVLRFFTPLRSAQNDCTQ